MKFKSLEYYKNLYNNVYDIDLVKTNYGNQISFVSKKKINLNEFSIALILNYAILKNNFEQESNGESKFENENELYKNFCKFFNQEEHKITLNNLFNKFDLDEDTFDNESLKVYSIAFANIKKSLDKDLVM